LERDFLVLEMETRLSKSEMSDEFGKKGETRCMRESMKTAPDQSLLPLLTQIATKTKENEFFFSFNYFEQMFMFLRFRNRKAIIKVRSDDSLFCVLRITYYVFRLRFSYVIFTSFLNLR
jgi:hypothetical protein